MNVEVKPELERRLQAMAERRSQPLSQLVEEAMISYLETLENESSAWVEATRRVLPGVWPQEDFTDWDPPVAR